MSDNLIYRVNLNYYHFDFNDHSTADGFAALAKSHFSGGGVGDDKIKVTVAYKTEEEIEQEANK